MNDFDKLYVYEKNLGLHRNSTRGINDNDDYKISETTSSNNRNVSNVY